MASNKKTATVTWIKYNNFGTLLQAYALQQYILSLGYENHILNDKTIPLSIKPITKYKRTKQIIKKNLRSLLPKNFVYQKNAKKSNSLFQKFIIDNLIVDDNINNLSKINQSYDQFIFGSDQIWNYWDVTYNPFYLGNFTTKKKISYAPSLGVDIIPKCDISEFTQLIDSFIHLSAREPSGSKIINSLIHRKCSVVVDPTLLLSEEKWRHLIGIKKTRPIVLAYFLSTNQWYMEYVKEYSKKHKLNLYTFHNHPFPLSFADEFIAAGPIEFMKAIDSASVVFTDSFHGSIFSMLLRTPFITFKRFSDDSSDAGQNKRLENLFSMLGSPERFIGRNELHLIENLPNLNFEKMKTNINPFIEESKRYLTESLKY